MKLQIRIGMSNDYSCSDTRLNDYSAFVIIKDGNGIIRSALKTNGMEKVSFVKVVKSLAAEFGITVDVEALFADTIEKVQQRIAEVKA